MTRPGKVLLSVVFAALTTFAQSGAAATSFVVTHTGDEGSGSLRQAILDSYAACTTSPCTIEFRIPAPVPSAGSFTIRPQTPLPEIRGFVKIDGATQTAFTGDTNAQGPEIEINGSQLRFPGHGLLLGSGCEIQVLDLAVSGFPYPGIEARRGPVPEGCGTTLFPNTVIARNYVGTDATGRTAVPNYRGVVVTGTPYAAIHDNLISGNARAGIFVERSLYVKIERNRVGVSSANEPLGNGASGLFLDVGERQFRHGPSDGADVTENVVAYNGEWGIARTVSGDMAIRRNSIFANRYLGIDAGLDFETPNRNDDDAGGVPNKPSLFFAQYVPADDKTIVRFLINSGEVFRGTEHIVDFYASSALSTAGQAQAEQWLGSMSLASAAYVETVMEIAGDFRGRFITATTTRPYLVGFAKPGDATSQSHGSQVPADTSELSNAVRVH